MKFKYSEYLFNDGSTLSRPTISITFKYKSKFLPMEALIDSGADFTILPIEIADILNVALDSKSEKTFQGAGGNPFDVYFSSVAVEHILEQTGFRQIKWKTKVFFAKDQPTVLLGQKGFLERFKVTLDGRKKEVEVCV